MRKLKLQVQMSVDGFIAGTNAEMDWLVFDWDEGLNHYVKELTDPVDCIVLGRKLAQGFIPIGRGWQQIRRHRIILLDRSSLKRKKSYSLKHWKNPIGQTLCWSRATLRMRS